MSAQPEEPGGFSHVALLYSDTAELLAGIKAFLGPAALAGDPVLALLRPPEIDDVKAEVGPGASNISFADITNAGGNPARIIGVWRQFADTHPGRRLWGIGEAAFPGRSSAELAECELYEALLSAAFDITTPLHLLCPYNVAELPGEVIEGAERTHPFVIRDGVRTASDRFRPINIAEPYAPPLPATPADAACLAFERGGLGQLRGFVATHAVQAGLGQQSINSLVAAINEIATNSLQHGGGHGELRIWTHDGSLLCEVSDQGHITAPLAGRLPPAPDAGAGLWLVNQLTDLVQIHSVPGGTQVRVHQKL